MDKFTEQGCHNLYDGNGILIKAVAIEQKDFGVIAEVVDLEGESVYRILRAMNSHDDLMHAVQAASDTLHIFKGNQNPVCIENAIKILTTAYAKAERGE